MNTRIQRLLATVAGMATALSLAACADEPPEPTKTETVLVIQPQATATATKTITAGPQAPKETTPAVSQPVATAPLSQKPDGKNEYWIDPEKEYSSPWHLKSLTVSIPFGCVDSPFYDPDDRCGYGAGIGRQMGFHHGVDIKMPVGTRLYSGVKGTVIAHDAPGTPGSVYGKNVFRIRYQADDGKEYDVVIGHTSENFVQPGDEVFENDPIALSGKEALPAGDPPHVHIELRPAGASYKDALCPYEVAWLKYGDPSCTS